MPRGVLQDAPSIQARTMLPEPRNMTTLTHPDTSLAFLLDSHPSSMPAVVPTVHSNRVLKIALTLPLSPRHRPLAPEPTTANPYQLALHPLVSPDSRDTIGLIFGFICNPQLFE